MDSNRTSNRVKEKTSLISDRVPPQAVELEKSVIAAALIDETVLDTVMEMAREEDFYSGSNRLIYIAMQTLYERDNTVDVALLAEQLRKMEKLNDIGGEPYLGELLGTVATSGNVEHYIEI